MEAGHHRRDRRPYSPLPSRGGRLFVCAAVVATGCTCPLLLTPQPLTCLPCAAILLIRIPRLAQQIEEVFDSTALSESECGPWLVLFVFGCHQSGPVVLDRLSLTLWCSDTPHPVSGHPDRYTPVTCRGRFRHSGEMHVAPRVHNSVVGSYVITPFEVRPRGWGGILSCW